MFFLFILSAGYEKIWNSAHPAHVLAQAETQTAACSALIA